VNGFNNNQVTIQNFNELKHWANRRILAQEKTSAIAIWIAAGIPCIASLIAAYFISIEVLAGDIEMALLYVFPLAGLLIFCSVIYKLFKLAYFDATNLVLSTYPGEIGGHLAAEIQIRNCASSYVNYEMSFEVFVVCRQVDDRYVGRHARYVTVWSSAGLARPSSNLGGTEVKFEFEIPNDLPESNLAYPDTTHWSVCLIAKKVFPNGISKTVLSRNFSIPVFKTEKQVNAPLTVSSVERYCEAERNKFSNNIKQASYHSKILLDKSLRYHITERGHEFIYPILRVSDWTPHVVSPVFSLVFLVLGLWIVDMFKGHSSLGGAIATTFSLLSFFIAAIVLVITFCSLFNSMRIRFSDKHIQRQRRLFGLPISNYYIEYEEAGEVVYREPISPSDRFLTTMFGHKINLYDIFFKPVEGADVLLGDSIRGELKAQLLTDHLNELIMK